MTTSQFNLISAFHLKGLLAQNKGDTVEPLFKLFIILAFEIEMYDTSMSATEAPHVTPCLPIILGKIFTLAFPYCSRELMDGNI
jgi:hypothetical protein